jgi:hypothetical protein
MQNTPNNWPLGEYTYIALALLILVCVVGMRYLEKQNKKRD